MKKYSLISVIMMTLLGCHHTYSQDYLLHHPNVLFDELNHCQQSQIASPYCDQVIETAEQFTRLANSQSEQPEDFGKQVLQAEEKMVDLQENLNKANAQDKKILAQAYQVQASYVKTLLAVISRATTPGL